MLEEKIYKYFERNPELRVLFIFINPYLKDELQHITWNDGFRYVEFKGDWFTCKYKLDTEWANDKVIFYFDMPSPLEDRKLRDKFPLMDVLKANMVFHNEDSTAFIQQYHLPQTMATFVEKNIMLLQSSKMLNMLIPYYQEGNINNDVAVRGILSMFLLQTRVLDWDEILIRVLLQGRNSEKSNRNAFHKKLQGSPMISDALYKRFSDIFGVTIEPNTESKVGKIVQSFKYNAIVQNLAVEADDNYKAYRINNSATLQQLNRLLQRIIENTKYKNDFDELLDELGATIRCYELVKWYGAEANYYYIPDDLCVHILGSILEIGISSDPHKVIGRISELMTKREYSDELNSVMYFIVGVAEFYDAASSIKTLTRNTPNDYILFYENEFSQIDYLYRHEVEQYYDISSSNELIDSVRQTKEEVDQHYAKLTNRLNLEWTGCLKDCGGFSSLTQIRQWEFYDKLIRPIQKKVAVIICDAMRYEMARQIVKELAGTIHTAEISVGIATLPTETKFCKPSLLPHSSLKLYGKNGEQDMSVDDKILSDTDKRSEHLQQYRDGAVCVSYETIAGRNSSKNREFFKQHPLVYIFHNSIDENGHSNSPRQCVKGCAQAITEIAETVGTILSSCNVTQVYVTSDHGFLFNDIPFEEKDKHKVMEDTLEQKTRYYLTTSDEDVSGVIKFPLDEVSGMKDASNVKVAVPLGTNRFAAPSGGYMFTHGGATLQELLIPIIVCQQERTNTKEPVGVQVLERNLSVQSSRIRFNLLQTETVSMEKRERTVTVALYDNDTAVTPVKQIKLDSTEPLLDKRKVMVDLTLNRNVNPNNILRLKVYDVEDSNNPLICENVTNNTLIEPDF
ncbi:MAG: PglZ domain-containing protein [Prevotella sp.]|nr:PglZ domain-containing protein [Prevotella sp.]